MARKPFAIPEESDITRRSFRLQGREGVSPVIATVLMVAITVVLAGSLYIVISNFIMPRSRVHPFIALDVPRPDGSGNWVVDINPVAADEPISAYEVVLIRNSTEVVLQARLQSGLVAHVPPYSLNYLDLGSDGRLNGGDSIILGGLSPGSTYELALLFGGEQVARSQPIRP